MKKNNYYLIILLFSLGIMMIACNKEGDNDIVPDPVDINVTFNFSHSVGQDNLVFTSIDYTNAFGNQYSVETLKYFISNITLHEAKGGSYLIDEEHYIDATNNTTLIFEPTDNIPDGTYSEISFVFGLDSTKNTIGRFTNPPESNMEWPVPMGGGYHYMKLEGKFNTSDNPGNYQAHTGPSMGMQYFLNISLPVSSFTVSQNEEITITIDMDINKWWENPNTLDLNDITAIMGNAEFQQKLHDNGMDVFSIGSVE